MSDGEALIRINSWRNTTADFQTELIRLLTEIRLDVEEASIKEMKQGIYGLVMKRLRYWFGES